MPGQTDSIKNSYSLFLAGHVPHPHYEGHFNVAGDALAAKGFRVRSVIAALRATEKIVGLDESLRVFRAAVWQSFVKCDGLALLDGWQDDRTARLLRDVARHIGVPAFSVQTWIESAEIVRPGVAKVVSQEFPRIPLDGKGSLIDLSADPEQVGWMSEAVTTALPRVPTQALPIVEGP